MSFMSWLDRHIAEQSQQAAVVYGDAQIVSKAAEAIELFSEDELEQYAALRHGRSPCSAK